MCSIHPGWCDGSHSAPERPPHTAYWWRGDRVRKPISVWGWLGGHEGQRPAGEFGQDARVTPLLLMKCIHVKLTAFYLSAWKKNIMVSIKILSSKSVFKASDQIRILYIYIYIYIYICVCIYNCNNISQCYSFYFIFGQINIALVSRRNLFYFKKPYQSYTCKYWPFKISYFKKSINLFI